MGDDAALVGWTSGSIVVWDLLRCEVRWSCSARVRAMDVHATRPHIVACVANDTDEDEDEDEGKGKGKGKGESVVVFGSHDGAVLCRIKLEARGVSVVFMTSWNADFGCLDDHGGFTVFSQRTASAFKKQKEEEEQQEEEEKRREVTRRMAASMQAGMRQAHERSQLQPALPSSSSSSLLSLSRQVGPRLSEMGLLDTSGSYVGSVAQLYAAYLDQALVKKKAT